MNNILLEITLNFHITDNGMHILTQGYSDEEIYNDTLLLKKYCKQMPIQVDTLASSFSSRLWTLLGEIAVPEKLGGSVPKCWPVLIFPCGMSYCSKIESAINAFGAQVAQKQECVVTDLLHASLYAGQAWYPSLRQAFMESIKEFGNQGMVFWMRNIHRKNTTLAAIARKLQLQLRPQLPEWKMSYTGYLYPGIQRTFHTPSLENIALHSLILEQAK